MNEENDKEKVKEKEESTNRIYNSNPNITTDTKLDNLSSNNFHSHNSTSSICSNNKVSTKS